ncbi:hypothetical protein FOZ62_012838, partial [Perkinsus olseni]
AVSWREHDILQSPSWPLSMASSGIILLKLKKRIEFKSHVHYDGIDPSKLTVALSWLKRHNLHYEDVTILRPEIWIAQCNDQLHCDGSESSESGESTQSLGENLDVLSDGTGSDASDALMPSVPQLPTVLLPEENPPDERIRHLAIGGGRLKIAAIAPGEGRDPLPIGGDSDAEVLCFPHLFPTGKWGWKAERDIPLSPLQYFESRLLHEEPRFRADAEYCFYALSCKEYTSVLSNASIAVRKTSSSTADGSRLTASGALV